MRPSRPTRFRRHVNGIDNVNTATKIIEVDVHFKLSGESFVWDSEKALQNERKHGIRFDEAAGVFFDPLFVIVDASRNAEARNAAIGFDVPGRLLYVVHVEFEETCIRIISARRATAREERHYAQ